MVFVALVMLIVLCVLLPKSITHIQVAKLVVKEDAVLPDTYAATVLKKVKLAVRVAQSGVTVVCE